MLVGADAGASPKNKGSKGDERGQDATHIEVLPSPRYTPYLGGQGSGLKGADRPDTGQKGRKAPAGDDSSMGLPKSRVWATQLLGAGRA